MEEVVECVTSEEEVKVEEIFATSRRLSLKSVLILGISSWSKAVELNLEGGSVLTASVMGSAAIQQQLS